MPKESEDLTALRIFVGLDLQFMVRFVVVGVKTVGFSRVTYHV